LKLESKKIIGFCKLCNEEKGLNFEHYPPKSAFNKNTRYYSIPSNEFYKNADKESLLNYKPKGMKKQGGLGDYCLCIDCNDFLGSNYVREYKKWANLGMDIINSGEFKSCCFKTNDIDYLKILKQIVSIFICNNDKIFTEMYKGLQEFVRDINSNELPSRYRIYAYLNNEGQLRNGNINYTNLYGAVCEFTFRPFGYVLSIDNENKFENLTELTELQKIKDFDKVEIEMYLSKYPTYLPFPLDFRTKDDIIKANH
jgi:hypothetical protein